MYSKSKRLEVKGRVTGDFNGEIEWVDIKVY